MKPHSPFRLLTVALLMFVSVLALAPFGPGTRAQESIELRIWDQFTEPTESATIDAIYDAFTEANPNITITREAFQLDQMRETVNTAISSGTGPDIIFYDAGPGYAGVLANAGLVVPLDQYADQYGWRDRVAASSLERSSINGQLFGMPLQVDLIGMYYNQGLIEEAGLTVPQTFDELVTFCQQASEAGYDPPLAFGNLEGWEAFHQFSMMANQMVGPEAINQVLTGGQPAWDSPEIVTAIQKYFVDLREAGCYSEDSNALNYDDGNSLFFSGQSLVYPTGSWLINDIQNNMPDANIGFMPFPELSEGTGRVWVSGVSSAYYITSGAENPDAAAQFIDYLFAPETMTRFVNETKFLVPAQFDAAGVEASPLFQQMLDTLQQATEQGTVLGANVDVLAPPQFNEAMTSGFQSIIAGDRTPEEVAAELQAAWLEGMPTEAASPEA